VGSPKDAPSWLCQHLLLRRSTVDLKYSSIHIKNFRSLGDVELELRNLTVLVGANSSGKTNSLDAISFLQTCVESGSPPAQGRFEKSIKSGSSEDISISRNVELGCE
jgi:AAA15 family ATPase/GTPase